MKILITGFSGFVARHFVDHLEHNGIESEILGIDIIPPQSDFNNYSNLSVRFEQVDMLDGATVESVFGMFMPEYVLHLASYSSVGFSWKNPVLTFKNITGIHLNLLEAVRKYSPSCRVLSVGSSEVYGSVTEDSLPLSEEHELSPLNPYAAARVSQENLSKIYCGGYGLDIITTRSFNHIGPGQKDIFVIASFAKQLVEIKKGIKPEKKLVTGDISVIRDFLDVRDVVDAYYRLMINGVTGEAYNICSGDGIGLNKIIDMLCSILKISIQIETDKSLIRPNDSRIIFGSNNKLTSSIEWQRKISLERTLADIIEYWDEKLK